MRIGVLFTGDTSWAGGLYYSFNIIKQLQQIAPTTSIKILVFYNRSTPKELIEELDLPFIELIDLENKSFLYKLKCKVWGRITRSNYRFVNDINSEHPDVLFPVINYESSHQQLKCRVIYWLYDFQHKFLPELFSAEEIQKRELNFESIIQQAETIVISSNDSKNHLLKFYPDCKANLFVYRFVSLVQNAYHELKTQLPANYLVVCNQFWPHKNHLIVLKALHLLHQQKKNVFIVFTGKYNDARNKTYVDSLQEFMTKNSLQSGLLFTGFIAREEQLKIIEKSKAVIQPSLFEGWSTVIEDAKALNKFVIASDIAIHREQIENGVSFFKPDDTNYLAECMWQVFSSESKDTPRNYASNCEQSKKDLINLFKLKNKL